MNKSFISIKLFSSISHPYDSHKEIGITGVSAVRVISSFRLNRTDSNFGWFVSWRDRSDPAAHAKH
jgi:hypothetical protein